MSLLSILVPTYNRADYLKACLDSLLATTVPCEILIGDNASTDGTRDLVATYADPRLRYVRHPANLGALDNHNRLLAAAKGDYLCLFGDDDIALPGCFEVKAAILDANPQVAGVFSNLRLMDGRGVLYPPQHVFGRPDISYLCGRDDMAQLLINCSISWQTLVFRRDLYEKQGPLRQYADIRASDWDFLLGIARHGRLAYVNEPTVAVRVHGGNLTVDMLGDSGALARDMISIWRHWLLEAEEPPVVADLGWQTMRQVLMMAVQECHGQNPGLETVYQAQLAELRQAYRRRMEGRFAQAVGPLLPDWEDRDDEGRPLYRPDVTPLPIGLRRQVVFLHHSDWRGRLWREVVAGFVQAFGASDNVELLLWLDPAQGLPLEQVGVLLAEQLATTAADVADLPEISLMPEPLSPSELARLYATVQVVVSAGDPVSLRRGSQATACVMQQVDPAAWRQAAGLFLRRP